MAAPNSIASLLCRHSARLSDHATGMLTVLFRDIHADEGTLWLIDEAGENLVPVWNSGPHAAQFVGVFRQPLRAGLISLACISGQALCENNVHTNPQQDRTLDTRLSLRTQAMIAVPFVLREEPAGVISCVKLIAGDTEAGTIPPFTASDLAAAVAAAHSIQRQWEKP